MVEDLLISGPESAVLWTEYVIRNGGAKHLRSPVVGTSFYKYYTLDIFSVLLTISIVLLSFLYFIWRFVLNRLRRKILSKFKAL